jgi:hypothetical protein
MFGVVGLRRLTMTGRGCSAVRASAQRLGRDGETESLDQTLELPRAFRREPGLGSRRVEAPRRAGDDEGHVRSDRPHA